MTYRGIVLTLTVAGATTLATLAAAQAPTPTAPDTPVPLLKPHPIVSKSDEHRIVGKVVEIDRAEGRVKLATEDQGTVVTPAPAPLLQAIRVGETISVPRAEAPAPSASPRTR